METNHDERRANEDAEDRALERAAAELFGDLPDGVWVHCGGRVVYANGTLEAFLGDGSGRSLPGRLAMTLYAPEERPRVRAGLERLAEGAASEPARCRMVGLGGGCGDFEVASLVLPLAEWEDAHLIVEVVRAVPPC